MISPEARGAWNELATTLKPWLARRAPAGVDPNDVLQDVLLRLHTHGSAEPTALREEVAFGPYVYAIARNTLVDHVRRRSPSSPEPQDLVAETEPAYDASVEALMASYVAPFVALLPSPTREALVMTELEGLSHARAAELAGVSLSAMKARVRRGRAELRRVFDACCSFEQDSRGTVTSCEPRTNEEAGRRFRRLFGAANASTSEGLEVQECACALRDTSPDQGASSSNR